jgi:hypothetical protein
MKLGVIYQPGAANSQYRAIIPMQALERRGHTVVWPADRDVLPREFAQCDLVHCYRRTRMIDALPALAKRGVAITFDNDDDFSAAELNPLGRGLDAHRHNKWLAREMRRATRLADLTTTTNELLAESYRAAGADDVVVIDNHLPREMFGFGSNAKHDGVVVGWVAGGEHALDLERVPIAQALRQLLDAHPQLRVLTVGVRLPLQSARYEHIAHVPFPELLKITSRIDIGIAPLADTAFNRARSDVKLKEYGSGVATWLASPVGPYRALGEKQGGALVADDGWFAAIDELIRKPRMRRRRAKAALKWAKGETIERYAGDWESAFQRALERAERRSRLAAPTARRAAGAN